jgi:hypothetical protein
MPCPTMFVVDITTLGLDGMCCDVEVTDDVTGSKGSDHQRETSNQSQLLPRYPRSHLFVSSILPPHMNEQPQPSLPLLHLDILHSLTPSPKS